MKVLGIDLGIKKTGLAVSDELGIATRALPNLIPKSRQEDIEFLLKLCEQEQVEQVVIGYPLMPKSETEGPMAKRARSFAEKLQEELIKKNLNIKVNLLDERYTSKQAQERLINSDLSKKSRKSKIDSEVARILIEDFLANEKS